MNTEGAKAKYVGLPFLLMGLLFAVVGIVFYVRDGDPFTLSFAVAGGISIVIGIALIRRKDEIIPWE